MRDACYRPGADGKFRCDFKFGHYTIAWNGEATLCIDDLLRVINSLPRTSRGVDGTIEETPPDRKDSGCAFRPEAGKMS